MIFFILFGAGGFLIKLAYEIIAFNVKRIREEKECKSLSPKNS